MFLEASAGRATLETRHPSFFREAMFVDVSPTVLVDVDASKNGRFPVFLLKMISTWGVKWGYPYFWKHPCCIGKDVLLIRWWQLKRFLFIFTPNIGEMIPTFDEHNMFQVGWFNHQLVLIDFGSKAVARVWDEGSFRLKTSVCDVCGL